MSETQASLSSTFYFYSCRGHCWALFRWYVKVVLGTGVTEFFSGSYPSPHPLFYSLLPSFFKLFFIQWASSTS